MARFLFVGSATQDTGEEISTGIHVFRIGNSGNPVELLHEVESGPNPSFLAVHPEKSFLYCVNETMNGSVSAFAINPLDGGLLFINRVQVLGDHPCYITMDPEGRSLLIANYGSGSLSVIPVNQDGSLGDCSQVIRHKGSAISELRQLASFDDRSGLLGRVTLPPYSNVLSSGVNQSRQEQSHAHSIVLDPTKRFALVADLGMDRVWVYVFVKDRLKVNTPQSYGGLAGYEPSALSKDWEEMGWSDPVSGYDRFDNLLKTNQPMAGQNLKPGAGPRHIVFHPNSRFFYVSNELDSTVVAFAWNGRAGSLAPLQSISTLPINYPGENYPAHVAITPDGRYLYVSNRGHNSLASFLIDSDTGLLCPIGHYSTEGDWPRHFCLDPEGRHLIAANQMSGSLVTFSIDADTGSLTRCGDIVSVHTPFFATVLSLSE